MNILRLSLCLLFALLATGCSTHTVEKSVNIQKVTSEEPVLGQPAHGAQRP
jgi:hypothetical protein